ncbi:flagellar basal body rod protein FlgB [Cellulomonas edaphi]|uniref:Flagellar basal body rod protein FlgB n=1 Tax=Cellulomonas edaphi TaxID=3053468 RepID=A0ABT7S4K6_9CELL|nr:flagellar basal body protein [Cellulomons edaphi]MDM7830540.1 flagellar basal body protein [Cellulomons edaphi]
MGLMDSVSHVALGSALDGLALRQRAIADNVANLQTPGYHARVVEFEGALESAVRNGNGAAGAQMHRSLAATREDGNNVNLDEQTLLNVETNLRYQVASQAISGDFASMRAALRTA